MSLGMCHKQRCPSASPTPTGLTQVFEVDFPHSVSALNLKHPRETGRMGVMITLI